MKVLSYALLLCMALVFTGCGFNIQKEIDRLAVDGKISKEEFLNLQKMASSKPEYGKFKDAYELHRYIEKYLKAKKVEASVWSPVKKAATPFKINVYLENSFSMDGYLYQADFKSSIYDMLVNAKQLSKEINLNFVNSNIIPAPSHDIKAYSVGLTEAVFKKLGGTRGVSDLADVITKVLSKTNSGNASILISDFVFSPPKKLNASSYLNIQQVAIKEAFRDHPNLKNMAVAIFQMKAIFNGYYFDHNSNPIMLSGIDRPYYIWIIGTREQVQLAINKQLIGDGDGHLLNKVIFNSSLDSKQIKYKVVNKDKLGDYKIKSTNEISDAESENGEFGFCIAVDFRENLKGLSYFSSPAVYNVNDKDYSVIVRALNKKELGSPALESYTHLLTLKTNKLKAGELRVSVRDQLPGWVSKSSSTDDSSIKTNTSEQQKTFGLNYLVKGVAEGFYFGGQADITELKIKIER